jgi:DNA-binding HxlR family transcriptional regulator
MRSYRQYCALAKALDVVGDRWTLLIVRELGLRGPCRYTDLQYGLPGIATNMLADRLREMEEGGIVRRESAPPPVATTLFQLTDRGEALAPMLVALGRWGAELMSDRADDDEFRSHWLRYPIERLLTDAAPHEPPAVIELRTGDQPMLVEVGEGTVRAHPGTVEHPDVVVSGGPDVIVGLLTRRFDLRAARRKGLRVEGDVDALLRLQPQP